MKKKPHMALSIHNYVFTLLTLIFCNFVSFNMTAHIIERRRTKNCPLPFLFCSHRLSNIKWKWEKTLFFFFCVHFKSIPFYFYKLSSFQTTFNQRSHLNIGGAGVLEYLISSVEKKTIFHFNFLSIFAKIKELGANRTLFNQGVEHSKNAS